MKGRKLKASYFYPKLYFTIFNQFSIQVVSIKHSEIDTQESEIYNAYLSSVTLGLVIYWINNYPRYTPEYISKQLVEINRTRPLQLWLSLNNDDKQDVQELVLNDKSALSHLKHIDPRILRSRKKLKDSLISLMDQKEFKKITIREIAEHARINRVTFYNHFQKKEDILNEICQDIIEGLITPFKPSSKNTAKDKEKKTYQSFLSFFSFVEENYHFFKVMQTDNFPIKSFSKVYSSLCTYFQNSITHISHTTSLPKHSIDPKIFGCYTTAALLGIINYWVKSSNMKYSSKYMAEIMTAIVINTPKSITSMKGSRQIYADLQR